MIELMEHPLAESLPLERIVAGGTGAGTGEPDRCMRLTIRGRDAAIVRPDHISDEALSAPVVLENLACKATGVLAVLRLVASTGLDPGSVEYVIGCAEDAVGDRYQRGGGNMAKAIAGTAGLVNASGCDVKDFCAAPVPAIITAAALVNSGVFNRVLVVTGGSLPKLGMKFQGHLKQAIPILEDTLAGMAVMVERNDDISPRLMLESVGKHPVGAGAAAMQIMKSLVVEPISRLGLKMTDIYDYATELQNPELTEPQESGNVPERNYRTIAAIAATNGSIIRCEMPNFVAIRGMPGLRRGKGISPQERATYHTPYKARAQGGRGLYRTARKGTSLSRSNVAAVGRHELHPIHQRMSTSVAFGNPQREGMQT